MDTPKCYNCLRPSRYYCTCVTPSISFCKIHQETHEDSPGVHTIKLYKAQVFSANAQVKKALINQICQVQREAQKKSEEVLQNLNTLMLDIQESFGRVLEKLNRFVSTCIGLVEEINRIETISEKTVYCPLEVILLSTEASDIISKIKAPVVAFNQGDGLPIYSPSVFPHFIYNLSDLSLYIPENGKITVFPAKKDIIYPPIIESMRFLNIGKKSVLCSGGENEDETPTKVSFIINTENQGITELSCLNYPRKYHSMSWLDRCPAVIGGYDGKNKMQSVEIFKNEKWIEMKMINIPRRSPTALVTQQNTWIIGGSNDNSCLDSIEKYEKDSWSLLPITLPIRAKAIGVCSMENNLLLIGGYSAKGSINNVLFIDIARLHIAELSHIKIPSYFAHNSILVESDYITAVGDDPENKSEITRISVTEIKL